jgi:glycosyltransferase involved in cell wall biosynthesis
MKIQFLIHDIHLGGGGERATIGLANNLCQNGYDVCILSLSQRKDDNLYTTHPAIDVKYLNINFHSGFNLFNKIDSILKVRKHFNGYTGKTILFGVGNYPSLLLCFLPKSKTLKKIGRQHLAYSGIKNIWVIMRWLLFRRLDRVVSETEHDLSSFRKLNKNTVHIPNSNSFFPQQVATLTNKRILLIGRMVPDKGYDLLFKVISKFQANHPDWEFRVIGDGPLRPKIEEMIVSLKLEDQVSILSSTKTILQEYLQASIYLMTSRTEGLPLVLLEAQACGLPIVAFDCETGPAEIVRHGEDGYLVEPGDIDTMVDRLVELANDFEKRKAFGIRARENAKRFLPEEIYKQWDELFHNL